MTTPLHQLKADLFKALGNPIRVRVLELLCEREHAVGEMLADLGVESSALSQQLAVLRGTGLVAARRDGSTVTYAVTTPRWPTCLPSRAGCRPSSSGTRWSCSATCAPRSRTPGHIGGAVHESDHEDP